MMLPQHKEQSLQQARETKMRSRPKLDPQEQELIFQEIGYALQSRSEITLTLFGSYGDRIITGQPVIYNQHKKTLNLNVGGDIEWVLINDIIGVVNSD
ncbi:YolD-like family protein [Paenibacillus sp. HJGM_3]|uniref:YolD-like family protein n=1 Tax=Paenibacillus sp. HJGM_3 TaxID=3379816 RepID=UPI00385D12EB